MYLKVLIYRINILNRITIDKCVSFKSSRALGQDIGEMFLHGAVLQILSDEFYVTLPVKFRTVVIVLCKNERDDRVPDPVEYSSCCTWPLCPLLLGRGFCNCSCGGVCCCGCCCGFWCWLWLDDTWRLQRREGEVFSPVIIIIVFINQVLIVNLFAVFIVSEVFILFTDCSGCFFTRCGCLGGGCCCWCCGSASWPASEMRISTECPQSGWWDRWSRSPGTQPPGGAGGALGAGAAGGAPCVHALPVIVARRPVVADIVLRVVSAPAPAAAANISQL